MQHPQIIQGGMGVAVSGWRLARAVSRLGQLGVVSGSILPVVFARRLQEGDADGALRRALGHFPLREMATRVVQDYFKPEGKAPTAPYRAVPLPSHQPPRAWTELSVVAAFAEVFLAREGHDGVVGINLLEKVQVQTLPTLFGAMLAGAAYVLMGAGIPRAIPGVLDAFASGQAAELRLDVAGMAADESPLMRFDPREFFGGAAPEVARPNFLAIVSSAALATSLVRKSSGRVDGLVVEGRLAGGHNAPPRGAQQLDAAGEPIYGPRDEPEIAKIAALGLPFWLAGSYDRPGGLEEARRAGATGIQVGTAFAFCHESGLTPEIKRETLQLAASGNTRVRTDPLASPTGFPFKVLELPGTLSEPAVYAARGRICDLGYLRQAYRRPDGTIGYRCAAEPEADYVRHGGDAADTVGRKCLCNGLLGAIGLGQYRAAEEGVEPALVTAGDGVRELARFVRPGADGFSATDVIKAMLEPAPTVS
jgi:nitronate monooxygenase